VGGFNLQTKFEPVMMLVEGGADPRCRVASVAGKACVMPLPSFIAAMATFLLFEGPSRR